VDLSVTISDVSLASQGVLGELADVAAVYGNDTLTDLTLRAAKAAMALSADKGGQVTDVNVTLGPSQMDFAAGQKLADFTLGADAMTVDVTYGQMPAAQVAMQRLETRLAVPMLPSEAWKPIALRLIFDEVTANDALWSMIDPRGALSRQPATLRLDLDGTARALVNLLEPEEGPAPAEPWEYGELTLNDLLLRLAGAEISGSAAGRIDNSGATPMPIGAAEFEMVGVSGLINTLGQIGLLTPQQTFPAQLMLGMFGKPTGAPDTFETRIEATEDGRILANGEPL
jgi:uncharacterized protein DUF2125